jgi:hypothetical protein
MQMRTNFSMKERNLSMRPLRGRIRLMSALSPSGWRNDSLGLVLGLTSCKGAKGRKRITFFSLCSVVGVDSVVEDDRNLSSASSVWMDSCSRREDFELWDRGSSYRKKKLS